MTEEYVIGLLGDPGTGKTTITLRGMNNTINNGRFRSQSTVDHRSFVFQVLDYNTPQEYKLLRENYIKASHGVMIIYAVNNRQSYDSVNGYIDYVRAINPAAAIILIANKTDLVNYRNVSEQDSLDQATMYGLRILSISATNDTADTLKHCYDTLIREIVRKRAMNNNANPPKNIQDFTNKSQSPRRQTDSSNKNNNRANSNAVQNGSENQDQQQNEDNVRPAGRTRANATTTNEKSMKRTKSFFNVTSRFITGLFKDDKKKSENNNNNTDNNTNQRETKSEEEKKTEGDDKDCIIS